MVGSQIVVVWFIAGVALMVLELVIPGGIVFFLGLGAAFVALLLHVGLIDSWIQAFTCWFIGSLAFLFGLRGVVQKLVLAEVDKSNTDEDIDAYNQTAKVVEEIVKNGEGRILFRGSTWVAKSVHADQALQAGTEVRIVFRDNLIWMVESLEETLSN